MDRCEREAHELLRLPRPRADDWERRRRDESEVVEDATPADLTGTEGPLARNDHAFRAGPPGIPAQDQEVVLLPFSIVRERLAASERQRPQRHRRYGGLLEKFPAIHVVSSLVIRTRSHHRSRFR